MNSLYSLGIKYNTDKSTYHEYTKFYETFLEKYRNDKLKILEVGIGWSDGGSLKMWKEYFANSHIYGADIDDKTNLKAPNIDIIQMNQEKIEDLRKLPSQLDLIIDDGGHTMFQQQLTLKILFLENLKDQGIYILEDLHTSLPHYYGREFGANANNNTLNLLLDLKEGKIRQNNEYFINEEEFNSLHTRIKSIDIYYNGPERDYSATSVIIKN